MNFLFFDIVPTNMVRFFSDVVHELNVEEDSSFYFLYEHDDDNDLSHIREAYPFAKDISYCQWKSISWFRDYIEVNNIDAIIFNGQRIADDRVVLAAKSIGVKTYMIQHGMYVPFLKRNVNFFTSKILKTISYLYYSCLIAIEKLSPDITIRYLLCYVFGMNQVKVGINRRDLNVDHVFVYSNYWKDFHKAQFGYALCEQSIVGTPDLKNLKKFIELDVNNAVCYIAQTLVEDGRLNQQHQLDFFKSLVDITFDLKLDLIVKLHPRSNSQLYQYALNMQHVTFSPKVLPKTKYYVGHYSTLLAKAMCLSDSSVFIYEYDKHPTPDYFKKCSTGVVKNELDLSSALLNTSTVSSEDINYYFEAGDDYEKEISKHILNDLVVHNKK